MRDYGKVVPSFWTRGSGKALRGDALGQVVALYLFTCPAATMTGLFYLALPTLAHETGHSLDDVRAALDRVCAAGIARYDEGDELVWLPEMARIQVGDTLAPNDKRLKGIEREAWHYRDHEFFGEFVRKYAVPFGLRMTSPPSSQAPSGQPEAPYKPLPVNQKPLERGIPQEHDQEHEQEHDLAQGGEGSVDGQDDIGPTTAVSGQQPLIPDVAKGAAAEAARVSELWAFYLGFWKERVGRGAQPDLNRDRKRAIVNGLRLHGPEKARDLIRGLWLSPHHATDGYHDIIYAFRTTNEGRFLLLARGGGANVAAQPINGTPANGPGVVHENLRHVRPPPT